MAGGHDGSNDELTKGTTTRFVERLEEEIARAGEVAVGSEIDGYVVLEWIGSGGNGEVWRVRHPKTGEELALKLIKAKAPDGEEMVGFKREWETLRVLKHPNIARLYDCGWWKRAGVAAPYYVMELARTKNGKKALGVREFARQKKLTAEEKVGLMVGVCRALHHAHEKGVYHRDLKPGNIAVDELDGAAEDGLGVPKVIDFGLAKVLGAEILDPRSAVKPGDTGGTARYMSPEQVRGDAGDIGPWTDVHALGLITFELLADRLPYSVDNMPAEVMRERIQFARRARLAEVVKGADEELSDVLARATAARLDERTRSAKELGDELETWVEKRRARTRARAKVRGVVGRKRAVAMAGVACAAMVVAEVVGGWGVEELGLNAAYEVRLSRMLPEWVDRPYEDVVVVVIDEEMNEQGVVDELSAHLGVESCPVEDTGSLRRVQMRLARRLVEKAEPVAVALDIYYMSDTVYDQAAAADLRACVEGTLDRRQAPVVMAMPTIRMKDYGGVAGPEGMCPQFASLGPTAGTIQGIYEGDQLWKVDLLIQREGEAVAPSMPAQLYAIANGFSPARIFALGTADDGGVVKEPPSAAYPNGRELRLPAAPEYVIEKGDLKTARPLGYRKGDRTNVLMVDVPGRKNRDACTLSFASMARAAGGKEQTWKEEVAKRVKGKVVIIADVRAVRPDSPMSGITKEAAEDPSLEPELDPAVDPVWDLKGHPREGRVAGVYALATATQWLLDDRSVKFPFGGRTWVWTGVLCAAGVAAAWWGLGRRRRGWMWAAGAVAVAGAVWVGGVLWAYSAMAWYVGPWVPLSGLVLAGVGAWGVWRVKSSAEGERAG